MFNIKLLLVSIILISPIFTAFAQDKDWKQYASSIAGLKVDYPSNWTSKEMALGKVWHITFLSPGVKDDDVWMHAAIKVCIQPIGHTPTSSDSRSSCKQRDDHLSDNSKDPTVSEVTFEQNGLKIRKKIATDKYGRSNTYIYAFFIAKNKEFLISSSFTKRFNLDKYIPVFDQMLKTIQILEERETLTYRNDKYDFALTYPTSWKSCPIVALQNKDEEEILLLVPEGKLCNGSNYISVSRMAKFSNENNNRNLEEFLQDKVFTKTTPYVEFGNIHSAMGEKTDEKHIYRERYFYTNYPQTYELLKISEMCEVTNEVYQKEAKEILTTARRFLKFQ